MTLAARSLGAAARCGALLAACWAATRARFQQVERSCRTLAEISQRLRAIRECTVCTIEHGGHHPHLTDPHAVVAAMAPWLRQRQGLAAADGRPASGAGAGKSML
eukprot:6277133-Prymnesium_polylepis.2